jgi:hypothetical protein
MKYHMNSTENICTNWGPPIGGSECNAGDWRAERFFKNWCGETFAKLKGVPMVTQLRPITLLNSDYKLLTKMLVARLLIVFPDLLQSTQMCAVKGRSIFDGAAAILLAAEFLEGKQLPGYLVSFDFFHGFDRVCLQWVDSVMQAMGFGVILRQWIQTLHRGAHASFL